MFRVGGELLQLVVTEVLKFRAARSIDLLQRLDPLINMELSSLVLELLEARGTVGFSPVIWTCVGCNKTAKHVDQIHIYTPTCHVFPFLGLRFS